MATIEFLQKRVEGAQTKLEKLEKKMERIQKAKESNWENNPYYGRMIPLNFTKR